MYTISAATISHTHCLKQKKKKTGNATPLIAISGLNYNQIT